VALSFLERLTRLERPGCRPEARAETQAGPRAARPVSAPREGRRRQWALPVLILGVIVVILFYIQGSGERTAPFLFLLDWGAGDATAAARMAEAPLPVPRGAEIDLDRARALLAQGHARDALRLIERIGPGDPSRAVAARLREDIQRALLSEYEAGALPRPAVPVPVPGALSGRDQ
jgi:hypothetical protein